MDYLSLLNSPFNHFNVFVRYSSYTYWPSNESARLLSGGVLGRAQEPRLRPQGCRRKSWGARHLQGDVLLELA